MLTVSRNADETIDASAWFLYFFIRQLVSSQYSLMALTLINTKNITKHCVSSSHSCPLKLRFLCMENRCWFAILTRRWYNILRRTHSNLSVCLRDDKMRANLRILMFVWQCDSLMVIFGLYLDGLGNNSWKRSLCLTFTCSFVVVQIRKTQNWHLWILL